MNKKTTELNFFISIFASFHWPILNLLNVNFIEFFKYGFLSILQTEILILLLSIFVLLTFKLMCVKFPKKKENFYLFIFFSLCIFFFFFKQIYSLLGNFISFYLNFDSGAYVLFLTLYIGFVYLIFNLQNISRVTSFVVIFSYLLIIQPISSIALKYIKYDASQKTFTQTSNFNDLRFKIRPNIYVIIPDGYVGPRNLRNLTGLSLNNFFQQIKNYNFKIVDNPKSNYLGSASSVASFFHMEYFRDEFSDKFNPPPSDYFPAVLNKTNLPNFLKYLKINSYNFLMTSNWYVPCQKKNFFCADENDSRFNLTQSSNLIFKNTPLDLLFPKLFYLKVDNLSYVEKNFMKILSYEKPFFFFIHLMQPHDPHYYDKDCNLLNIKEIQSKNRLQNYKEAVQCVNKNLLKFAENLKKNDPSSIAVIFSDHGSGYIANKKRIAYSKSKSALDERTETIMLVKSPQECHKFLTTQMGPINLSRFIISCLSKKKIKYLDERILVPGPNYDETNSLVESFILKK